MLISFWLYLFVIKMYSGNDIFILKKVFYILGGKWNFLAPRLKDFLYFLKRKFFFIFSGTEFSSPKIKINQEGTYKLEKHGKTSYISEN